MGDIDTAALSRRHHDHGGGATVTAVPLPSQYGTLELDADDRVTGFREKPTLHEHWINAGFFVLDADAVRRHPGDDLEREVLPAIAGSGELYVYRHRGFWKSMDTLKDQAELDALAKDGRAPWQG